MTAPCQVNFAKQEVCLKIVYYGPGLAGKMTSLEAAHATASGTKTDVTSLSTEGDRTVFFDLSPDGPLGRLGPFTTRLLIYTVPTTCTYNATRKLVLQGASGVIFVSDSDPERMTENLESLANLEDNLRAQGLSLAETFLVFQWNKRDLPSALSLDELNERLNPSGRAGFESNATQRDGVLEPIRCLVELLGEHLRAEYGLDSVTVAPAEPAGFPKAPGPKSSEDEVSTPPGAGLLARAWRGLFGGRS